MIYRCFFLLLFAGITLTATAQKGRWRIMTYNIRNSKGMDNQTDYDRTVAVLKGSGADVIAVQELDSATTRAKGAVVLNVLAQKGGWHATYASAIPYQGGRYGVGILSREAPLRHFRMSMPGREEERVLLVAEYKNYVIFCTHLSLTDADRMASLSIINEQALKFTKPVYLMGDLNAEPGSPFITSLQKDWTLISGEDPTFPAPQPTKCIDYILVRNANKKVQSTTVLPEPVASDHRPVMVELK